MESAPSSIPIQPLDIICVKAVGGLFPSEINSQSKIFVVVNLLIVPIARKEVLK